MRTAKSRAIINHIIVLSLFSRPRSGGAASLARSESGERDNNRRPIFIEKEKSMKNHLSKSFVAIVAANKHRRSTYEHQTNDV